MKLFHRPLFLLLLAYIAGIAAAVHLHLAPIPGFAIAAGIAALAAILPLQVNSRLVLVLIAAVFALGFVRTQVNLRVPPSDVSRYAEGKLATITGTVVSDPVPTEYGARFVVRAEYMKNYVYEFPTSGRVMVTLLKSRSTPNAFMVPYYGERIRLHGRVARPDAEGAESRGYRDRLARRMIFCTMTAGSDRTKILAPAAHSLGWMAVATRSAIERLAFALFPALYAQLIMSILLGGYSSMPQETVNAFARSGTLHMMAASGYNCSIIVAIFGYVLRRVTAPRAAAYAVLIFLIWAFTLVAGAGPSIVRAAAMATAFLSAYLFRRTPDSLSAVFFAGLLILGINPLQLYDIGFQLSFSAVLSIILFMPLLKPLVLDPLSFYRFESRADREPYLRTVLTSAQSVAGALSISIVAIIGTGPVIAYYFNYVSVVAPAANVCTALLLVLLTALGIAALAAGACLPAVGQALAVPCLWIMKAMLGIVTSLGGYTWSVLSVSSPSPAAVAVYYLLLLGVLELAYRRFVPEKRVAGAA